MGNNKLGDAGATEIAEALKKNRTLTQLDLKFNGIEEAGARSLSEALDKNSQLLELQIVESGCTGPLLKDLYRPDGSGDVQYNKISLGMHSRIADQLIRNSINDIVDDISDDKPDFVSLELARAQLGSQCAEYLAASLEFNKNLTAINLERNPNLGASGLAHMKAGIEKHRSLTDLNFRHCNIGDEGAAIFADILNENPRLTSLNLCYNNITADGVYALADVIVKPHTYQLTYLDLESNPIGPEGDDKLEEAHTLIARSGGGLIRLKLDWCFGEKSSGPGFATDQINSIQAFLDGIVLPESKEDEDDEGEGEDDEGKDGGLD
jgi:Ran GTPase-activating protein (RanGAP) involved in mRNA processing and transport